MGGECRLMQGAGVFASAAPAMGHLPPCPTFRKKGWGVPGLKNQEDFGGIRTRPPQSPLTFNICLTGLGPTTKLRSDICFWEKPKSGPYVVRRYDICRIS